MNTPSLEQSIEFTINPEPRCACLLLLDTSGSMNGEPIASLNQGLRTFRDEVSRDSLASQRVEVCVVTFDSRVSVVHDFVTADQFVPPTLTAQYQTHTGAAVLLALDMLEQRKAVYKAVGVPYYRPWLFLITDGVPEGETPGVWEQAVDRVRKAESNKSLAFFSVGVEGADMAKLGQLGSRPPKALRGLAFTQLFQWLSASMSRIGNSQPDEQVALPAADWSVY